MSEIKIGASYPARRNGQIKVPLGKEGGALMVYIPYIICSDEIKFAGIQSVCIGQRDGSMRELDIQKLRDIFPEWTGWNPVELQRISFNPESTEPEFTLSDWGAQKKKNPADENEQVKYAFNYLNRLGESGGVQAATEDDEKAILEKWGEKLKLVAGVTEEADDAGDLAPEKETKTELKKETAKTAKSEAPKKSNPPGKKAAGGQARTSSESEVWDAYTAANKEVDEQVLADKFTDAKNEIKPGSAAPDATDEQSSLTPVQWGKVADLLKV